MKDRIKVNGEPEPSILFKIVQISISVILICILIFFRGVCDCEAALTERKIDKLLRARKGLTIIDIAFSVSYYLRNAFQTNS